MGVGGGGGLSRAQRRARHRGLCPPGVSSGLPPPGVTPPKSPEGQNRPWLRSTALKNAGSWAHLGPNDNIYRKHESSLQASQKKKKKKDTRNCFRRLLKQDKWSESVERPILTKEHGEPSRTVQLPSPRGLCLDGAGIQGFLPTDLSWSSAASKALL